jgi:Cu-processing system permease protein
LALIALKEMKEAWSNRWFLLFSGAFAVLALGLSWLSVTGVAGAAFAGFGRTAASLVHLVILVVPLMGLILGATAVAAERERGSLIYLLCQPIEPRELVVGKFLGMSGAALAALAAGFGLAALALSARGIAGSPSAYLAFLGLAGLLAMASVSVGLLISTLSSKVSLATGVGLFVWLTLVFLGDLGLMGTSVALRLEARDLLVAALLNPLQVFKMASLLAIRGGLEVLGPAGLFAVRTVGSRLVPLLVAVLLLWVLVPLTAAAVVLERRGGAA